MASSPLCWWLCTQTRGMVEGCGPLSIVVLRQSFPIASFQVATSNLSSGEKEPVTGQPKGKAVPKGQASKQSQALAAKHQKCRGGRAGELEVLVGGKLPSMTSKARVPQKPTFKVLIPQPPRREMEQLLKSRPEVFWSVLKEPQKTLLAGYSFQPSVLVPPVFEGSRSTQCHPVKTRSVASKVEWRLLE